MFFNKLQGNKRKVASNVVWAMTGKIVNMAGALLVGILVARYLGPSQYGLMNYIISYVTLFTVISSFGMDNIEIRELAKANGDEKYILGTCFGIRCGFSIIAYILISLSLFFFKADRYTTIMILTYSSVLFMQNFNIIRNYFFSIVENRYVVQTEISRTILGAIIKVVLLLMKAPLEYFIFATVFDTILIASGYFLSYKKKVGAILEWKFDKKRVPFIVKESFPLVLSGAAVIIYQKIDQVMIGNMIDKSSVGYFATACKFVDLILFIPTILTQTIVPLLIKEKQTMFPKEFRERKIQFIGVVTWISIIFAIIYTLFGYWFVSLTYGEKYLMAVPVLHIMAWKTVGMALSSSSGQIIIMEGLQKWSVLRNIVGCVVCIVLNMLIIPHYGIVGSAWVTIITVLCSGFLSNFIIKPYRDIFKLQCIGLFTGWKSLLLIKQIIKKQ